MYKKSGSALLFTVFIMLIANLICLNLIKIQINNTKNCYLNFDKKDVYNINIREEEFIYKAMKKINKMKKDNISDCFPIEDDDFSLQFDKDSGDIFLISSIQDYEIKKRKIDYKYKDDDIILIPTQFYI
ncbi:hypothetical protein [Clostridium sp. BJN0001]|uniref:hypothetical protein n=1 Tax=Clostridium sp. BJN0001 TaxID=2930219 RepID=UPI001FD021BF|nr:hypothetical protein [Clostridium sp. BJN0001]